MYSRIWSGEINWILKTDFQLKFWDESLSDDFIIVFSPKTLQDPQTLNASQDLSKVPYINMMMSSELGKDLSTWPGQLSIGITPPCKTPWVSVCREVSEAFMIYVFYLSSFKKPLSLWHFREACLK